jgi:hypothetical protein
MTFQRYQCCRRKQGVVLRLGRQGRRKLFVLRTTTPIYNPSGDPVKQAHLFVAALDISRAILLHRNYASSNYNALQAYSRRQFYHGLGATASYTWAHSLDDASNFNSGAFFPFSVNYSSSDFDIRQTFAASLVYDAPTPFKGNRLARTELGHWSFDPIYHYQTAPPINPAAVLSPSPVSGFADTLRPNLIRTSPLMSTERNMRQNMAPAQADSESTMRQRAPRWARHRRRQPWRDADKTTQPAHSAYRQAASLRAPRPAPVKAMSAETSCGDFGSANSTWIFIATSLPATASGFDLKRTFSTSSTRPISPHRALLTDSNFGASRSMTNSSFSSGNAATGGGYNSLYTMGGPRAVQLAVKLLF